MKTKVRLLAPLVFLDELQVAVLSNRKSKFVALAVPSATDSLFLVTSVTPDNLKAYLSEVVDLRFLFTYPHKRRSYYCTIEDPENIVLESHDQAISNAHLPDRGFFARCHTHEYEPDQAPTGVERLLLDGQWELADFARFQAKFADIYAFVAALKKVVSPLSDRDVLDAVQRAFLGKPLRGGSSYGSLFNDLTYLIPQYERLRLKRIKKASPGEMELRGSSELFSETQEHVERYLMTRGVADPIYKALYTLLQQNNLLKLDVARYSGSKVLSESIFELSRNLATVHDMPDFDAVYRLCANNELAAGKVVLAFHRRIEGAAEFFAQGRVAFTDEGAKGEVALN